ncbi:MAG: winged helix-turn-helix domain-containing protein [Candidatus Bathyarchaeia archaeon]
MLRLPWEIQHPNAFIPNLKNRKAGLRARSLILKALEERDLSLRDLSEQINLAPSTLLYHLKLLESRKLVQRRHVAKRRFVWEQTGLGQQPIL